MNLSEINIKDLCIEKQYKKNGQFNRTVYFDQKKNQYIKVWDKDFFYKPYFEHAFGLHFFDTISKINDIVKNDEGEIMGYITQAGTVINEQNIDNSKLENLTNRLIEATCQTYIVYIDYRIQNIIEIEGIYYIIDLDASVCSYRLNEIPTIQTILNHCLYDYRKKITQFTCGIDNLKTIKLQYNKTREIKYGTANGRIWLEHEYLPKVEGRTLFIGVNYYTEFYHLLVKNPELFETLDIQENLACYGSPYIHHVCNLLDFEGMGYQYDNIICFGLFGHKDSSWEIITERKQIIDCLNVIDEHLKHGGRLLFAPAMQTLTDVFWLEIFREIFGRTYYFENIHKIDINIILEARKNEK